MTFVDQDEIEKICGQLCQPLVLFALELVNVCDHDVGFLKIGLTRRAAPDFGRLRVLWPRQHGTLGIEELLASRIEILEKLVSNPQTGRQNQDAPRLES